MTAGIPVLDTPDEPKAGSEDWPPSMDAYAALRAEVERLKPHEGLWDKHQAIRLNLQKETWDAQCISRDLEAERDTLRAELAAAKDEIERLEMAVMKKLDKEDRCLDCCSELATVGPPGVGGEPSLICLYCESQEALATERAARERAEARVKELLLECGDFNLRTPHRPDCDTGRCKCGKDTFRNAIEVARKSEPAKAEGGAE